VLDMNFRWPNLGHDSIVHAVQEVAGDLAPGLGPAGLKVRALSFEVRERHQIPEGPGGRFGLYIGTGGPGHLDPHRNDGTGPGSQGVVEDPAWEAPLFRLFDAIDASEEAALLAVCHSFGVLCRWSGVAEPSLRGPEKGGKSAGIQENVLTAEGRRHPWFAQFAAELPDGRRLPVVDHRLFDLLPAAGGFAAGRVPIGHEALGVGGPEGDALTMMEFARDGAGVLPRIFGSNHHPEVVDRARQIRVLEEKRARGEVSDEWVEDRRRVLAQTYSDDTDHRLRLTSDYTLLLPLRFHLYRQVRFRAEALGLSLPLHEEQVLGAAAGDR
jgi:hypothetical protein